MFFKNAGKVIINKNYKKQIWRRFATKLESDAVMSSRAKAWKETRDKYEKYPNVLYNSFVESQVGHLPHRKKLYMEREMAKLLHDNSESISTTITATPQFPKSWMNDYEFYEGGLDETGNINSMHGTADPTIAPSSVPCSGCGSHLHCVSTSLPGYIPAEIFIGRKISELHTITCQRCHFLKHYNIALDVEVTPESYVQTISCIQNRFALAVVIVDLLDFPCSIWPGMQKLLGQKRPVFIVGNKVDLLPRDSNHYLEHVKKTLRQQIVQCGFNSLNIKHLCLISAKTGYGIEELITQLQKIWLYKGDVYLMGCTNVGKSTLFNILLNSDYCRPEASDLVRKATTCPWPGTTLQMLKFPILRPSEIRVYQRFQRLFSERAQKVAEEKLRKAQASRTGSLQSAQLIGKVERTYVPREDVADAFTMQTGTNPITMLNERAQVYREARWCYDTPGVMHPEQITNLLTTEELLLLQPKKMINPRAVRLQKGWSVFLAGLARLDFINSNQLELDWVKLFIFTSLDLPITITTTNRADDVYRNYLGTEMLAVPCGSVERLARWPGLHCKAEAEDLIAEGTDMEGMNCDIILSSAGWITLRLPVGAQVRLRAWTPHARGIYMRTPPLVRHVERLVGKRVRNSLGYHMSKPFVFRKK